jgi:tetratricopeptide (TPR) repeat protein
MRSMTPLEMLNLGHQHQQSGRLAEAEGLYRQVMALEPGNPAPYALLGLLAQQVGKTEVAVDLLRRAMELAPRNADIQSNLCSILLGMGRAGEAVEVGRSAIALNSGSPEIQHNLGIALLASGEAKEGAEHLRRALAINPGLTNTYVALANALIVQGEFEEAIACAKQVVELRPNSWAAYNTLAIVLRESGQVRESLGPYEKALAMNPEGAELHWNYSLSLLQAGDFERGWKEFEWRLRSEKMKFNRGLPQPKWDGSEVPGKTVLLMTEGGLGDALQFIRYAPMVAERAGRVILECQEELLRILALPCISEVVARGKALPPFDFQIPLQSLPEAFGTDLSSIPARVPYLSAPAQSVAYWKERLADEKRFKVGLAWAGSNKNTYDKRPRSLEIYAPLANLPGVRFFGLQKGPEGKQAIPVGLELINLGDELHDMGDTAGLAANLDLVISIDTSIVHLAGAMGKPVWVLLPFVCDFRWLCDREDSPWYPTMRLFRQGKREGWVEVVKRIAEELETTRSPQGRG